jgi:hypothetical protein
MPTARLSKSPAAAAAAETGTVQVNIDMCVLMQRPCLDRVYYFSATAGQLCIKQDLWDTLRTVMRLLQLDACSATSICQLLTYHTT